MMQSLVDIIERIEERVVEGLVEKYKQRREIGIQLFYNIASDVWFYAKRILEEEYKIKEPSFNVVDIIIIGGIIPTIELAIGNRAAAGMFFLAGLLLGLHTYRKRSYWKIMNYFEKRRYYIAERVLNRLRELNDNIY